MDSNDMYRRVIWQCDRKFNKTQEQCKPLYLTEDTIKVMFLKAHNWLMKQRMEKAPASLEEWDSQVWSLLERGTVNRDGSITFELRNGKKIKVEANGLRLFSCRSAL